MRIQSLTLTHFRNISQVTLTLHPTLTIFLGPNGIGKTNILEAIHLLSLPRSFRRAKDDQLRQWDSQFARVSGEIEIDGSQNSTLVVYIERHKTLQINGKISTTTSFMGTFLSILFSPEDVILLSGPPSDRRSFLDGHLSILSQKYLHTLLQYQQVLLRRNRLFASKQAHKDTLAYWNEAQASLGCALIEARIAGLRALEQYLPDGLTLPYTSTLIQPHQALLESFHQKQASLYERECAAGHTLLGPQRDDWMMVDRRTVERHLGVYGSRGEQRMGVISLKQAQLAMLRQQHGQAAVFLLDDVLSELDTQNQAILLQSFDQQQTILTTPSLSDVPKELLRNATIYELTSDGWRSR
jgi:DNA replication and repair protein RecF